MRWALIAIVVVTACGDDKGVSSIDAPAIDVDAAIDAPTTTNTVACGDSTTSCAAPGQYCCDMAGGTDTCMPSPPNGCTGNAMQCDGSEDCPAQMECCLFAGQGSRCIQTGIC